MFTKIKNEILAVVSQLHTVRQAIIVWNQTQSVEQTKKAMNA